MDVLHKMLKMLDHNRWTVGLMAVAVLVSAGLVGCQPETMSLVDPDRRVTAVGLARETTALKAGLEKRQSALDVDVTALADQTGIASSEIEAKTELRRTIVETLGGIGTAVAEGSFSATSGVGAVIQLALAGLAGGGLLDRRRKDQVIAKLKNGKE